MDLDSKELRHILYGISDKILVLLAELYTVDGLDSNI